MDNFYMVLPSNSSATIYPDNTASNFKIDWETPIYLDGQWEIALYEISFIYPPSTYLSNAVMQYSRVNRASYKIIFSTYQADVKIRFTDEQDLSLSMSKKSGRLVLKSSRNEFKLEFIRIESANLFGFNNLVIQSVDKTITSDNDLSIKHGFGKATITYPSLVETDHMIRFEDDLTIPTLQHLRNYISERCADAFKSVTLEQKKFVFELWPYVTKIGFDKAIGTSLGLGGVHFTKQNLKDNKIYALHDAKLEKTSRHMYVYTSLIDPIIVGDVRAPLLKSIWIEDKFTTSDVVYISMEHPMYLPIMCDRINNIEFNIRDDSGKFINFGKDTVSLLTVHLRKANE